MKDEGCPFKSVFERILETINVNKIPKMIIPVKINTLKKEENNPACEPTKNIVMRAISVGNLPLHGTNTLVKMAINRSLGESMILHPVTPQALQPNPIHIVSACFPQAAHF